VKRTLAIGLLFVMLTALLPATAMATDPAPVRGSDLFITLAVLPQVTHDRTIIVRGIHSPGAVIDVRVNGRLEATGSPDGNVYWAEVHLDRGENHIVSYAKYNGVTATAEFDVFRAEVSFADTENHWAQKEIEVLATLRIVSGIAPGLFGPGLRITRAEFAKLLVLGLSLQPRDGSVLPFRDADLIPPWARGYVAAAVHHGLISGFADGTFGADQPVSRLQIAVMLGRALRLRQYQPSGNLKHFVDASRLPQWAQAETSLAVRAGVIAGFADGTFRPLAITTRAEAAAAVYRVWQVTRPTHQN